MTRILLVEDSEEHAEIIRRALEAKRGWTVVRTGTAKEAMLQAALKDFDLALVDYKLPDGDGIDLLDSLRQQSPGMPIVFLTAHGSEEVAMQAMTRGASDYLSKGPHYQRDLAARCQDVLGRREDLARVAAAVKHSHEAASIPVKTSPSPPASNPGNGFNPEALAQLVSSFVGPGTDGAAIFDGKGKALASRLPAGVDATALGAALVGTQFQAQHALRQIPGAGPPRAVLMEMAGHLLAMAAVPGPALVVLLLEGSLEPADAVRRVREAAQRVWRSSQA